MDAVFMHVQTDLVQGFEIAELLANPINDKMVHLIHPKKIDHESTKGRKHEKKKR
jgi:hypothetical protein